MNDVLRKLENRFNVVIGLGDALCGAVRLSNYNNISENRNCYWIYDCILDLTMVIFKDTKEGQQLTSFIEGSINQKELQEWFDLLCLAKYPSNKEVSIRDLILHKIENHGNSKYEQGRRDKAKEIRKVLGL